MNHPATGNVDTPMNTSFERFAENSPDALASLDAKGRVLFANPAFARLFMSGRRRGDGCVLEDLDCSPGLRSALLRSVASAGRNGGEERFLSEERTEGEARPFFCRIVPCGGGGREGAVLVEVREVPTHAEPQGAQAAAPAPASDRPAEQSKDRQSRLVSGILDEFPGYVYLQRRDYTVAYANRRVRKLYGETGARLCYEVFSGRTSPCPVCPTFEVFDTGQPVEWEFEDHKGRTFRVYDYPFEDETGEPLVMELGIDITDLKRVEKELFEAQRLRAIGVLAGGIAHDLNNNLVPIIFNVDYALNRTVDTKTREPLSEALQAAYRAAKLVEQVLEYSRQQDVTRAPLRLKPLLRESAEAFRGEMSESVTFETSFDTPFDCVVANPAQVQQIVLNLLRNAEQAMPGGGTIALALGEATVRFRKMAPHPELVPGDYVTLSVRDSGVGIGAADLERIFEPFFTTKKADGGTGMGLAVVHAIVTSCGGAIKVESTPGAGTAFTVYLPRSVPPTGEILAEPCVIAGGSGRLLLVDDDPGALSAMARTLRDAGFDVDTARSGEEGIAAFALSPPAYSLVLADHSMPGMSGLEMSARLLGLHRDARIIICTGHVEPELEKEARAEGISGFAMKPMTPFTLVEMVQKYCR